VIDIEEPRRKSLLRRKPLSLFALLIILISSTYASTITLNNGNSIQYGAGVFQVKVCDTWIGVNLQGVYSGGVSYVGQIQILGLDVTACSGENLLLTLYNSGSQMNLFNDGSGSTAENHVTLSVNTSYYAGGPKGQVELITPAGVLTRNDSGYERILPEQPGGTFNGNYDVLFSSPLAQSSLVTSVGIQSTKQ
jgi:hypothetical protein